MYLFVGNLVLSQPSLAEEKIEIIHQIQSSEGLNDINLITLMVNLN